MDDQILMQNDLKWYPHFDDAISVEDATEYIQSPELVSKHNFFPFLKYSQRWTKYAKKGEKGKVKEREIRYAARKDAYIYMHYRRILSKSYEQCLLASGLNESILAYRKLLKKDGVSGKCNIDFAKEAFDEIKRLGDCTVVALDISSYFESLDHELLYCLWCQMLEVERLPKDHFHVFRNITSYSIVDLQDVYERLGYFGNKTKGKAGNDIKGYLVSKREMPTKLCDGKTFRQKIIGHGGKGKSLVRKNFKPYGIPQGAPISDLLANLYLLEFDKLVNSWMQAVGGKYLRYSDDILLILPGGKKEGIQYFRKVQESINKFGTKLKISDAKSSVFVFENNGEFQYFSVVFGEKGKNGLEYLGFRYNGRAVFIRDSTLSNLHRKITFEAKRQAYAHVLRYPGKNIEELKSLFNYEQAIKRFGRVEDFGSDGFPSEKSVYKSWTFWTYITRAVKTFQGTRNRFYRQMKCHEKIVRDRIDDGLARALRRVNAS
ncbi:hypothetical protein J0X12_12340 [Sneathiella sp. CAU 1612]|uniref:Reverse transcriptase domain-containing protein n=1 Tax=Sneathiella sedimenti TaxID=2816034 RepID=A0ABS3F7D8_9PROT|nr:reverse transcriptase domain-containing protein [Sneathiella sedimenti]MBO0334411.1 hypothetical protein [Sneathiella sedimenti]